MHRVRLICWKATEVEQRAARLRAAGYAVSAEALNPVLLQELRRDPPQAVVIDLARQPSTGRDVALSIRQRKATRHIPLVFAGGEADKVRRIRELLPDAVYTTWSRIRSSLKRAIAKPPTDPVVPGSTMAGYAGASLTKKLGIKPHAVVVLVNAPQGFEKTLGKLPPGVTLRRQNRGRRDLTLWFTRSRKDLEHRVEGMFPLAAKAGLWIAWPKKASPMASDLTQAVVRKLGLAAGMVDFKVCAIDADWSGLRFSHPRSR